MALSREVKPRGRSLKLNQNLRKTNQKKSFAVFVATMRKRKTTRAP